MWLAEELPAELRWAMVLERPPEDGWRYAVALSGVIMGPVLNHYVEANGWQASYQALAVFAVIAGVIVFLLIPPEPKARPAAAAAAGVALPKKRRARDDYPAIFRTKAFWCLLGAMLYQPANSQGPISSRLLLNGLFVKRFCRDVSSLAFWFESSFPPTVGRLLVVPAWRSCRQGGNASPVPLSPTSKCFRGIPRPSW